MTEPTAQKRAPRIANWFNFTRGPYKLRIEDESKPLTTAQAQKLADAIFERTGSFCGSCGIAAANRYVRAIEPAVARCHDCHYGNYSDAFTTTCRE